MGKRKGEAVRKRGRADRLLHDQITACRRCERLVAYCAGFNLPENRQDAGFEYWARPVSGFGDAKGALLVIGLAPGAQGANRTGRPFTGDYAGQVLYRALGRHGYANRMDVVDQNDGLRLSNVYISNAVKCVPPQNRPTGSEKRACLPWLEQEVDSLKQVRLVLAMGRDAFEAYLRLLKEKGRIKRLADYRFVHGQTYAFERDARILLASYHFSRYNINTGVLTEQMVEALFRQVGRLLKGG